MDNLRTNIEKYAYVFPGQGSQWIGMGHDIYQTYPEAKAVFDESDDILGFSLSQLCFQGPQEKLNQTDYAQPAIVTISIAYLKVLSRVLQKEILPPNMVAGHSLGEYTALIVANVLSLKDTLRLVQIRGQLMQREAEKTSSGMAAVIGLDKGILEEVCRESETEIANINSPGQIVISGTKDSLTKAAELAKSRGALRVIQLNVAGAFHSKFMQGAADELSSFISSLSFQNASLPIIANTSAQPVIYADDIKRELVKQLCNCVQWQSTVEYMVRSGVINFIEIGPGNVLTGLIKRISREAQVVNVGCVPH